MKTHLSRQLIGIILCKLLLNTVRRFTYPFAPALSRALDVPLTGITAIIATSQISSLLGIFSGPLADRFGYRLMMRIGLAMLAVGMLVCGLVPQYWPVFAGLVVASCGKTLFDPAIQAFVGNTVPYERRARIIGLLEIAWAGSTLVGIPALGLIIEHGGLRFTFVLLGLAGAAGWLVIGRSIGREEGEAEIRGRRQSLAALLLQLFQVRSAAGMLLFGFCISLANDCFFVVYGAWFEQAFLVSVVTLGFSTVAIGSAELLGEFGSSFLADRLGLKRATIIGLSVALCAYLLLPVISATLPLAMLGVFFLFFTFEFTMVTSFSLSTELMPGARATMMAGFYATAGIGRMLGVLLGGLLWQRGSITLICLVSAAISGLGLLSLIWGLSGWRRPGGESP